MNVLHNDEVTEKIISNLSQLITGKPFSSFFGGEELVELFQFMRPALMMLYAEKSRDEVYE